MPSFSCIIKIEFGGIDMKTKILEIVKINTESEKYKDNNAIFLSSQLQVSRNSVSQYLNELVNEMILLKIKDRPIYFVDKDILENKYHIQIPQYVYETEDEFLKLFQNSSKQDFQKLIGSEGSLKELVDKCKASISYPPHGLPILLHGPTGSGKSFIVSLMYEYAKNNHILLSDAKFIHVNCSEYANNPELLTANLFGYKKGAFTGADSDHIGLIKAAENGVLFLDEVHCLKAECQEKLFLFMDSGQYRMLGDNKNIYQSQVFLAFATTEDPQTVLLKTLYRRIPIRVEVPSIEDRGVKEKEQLILMAFSKEEKNMNRQIRLTQGAYNALLNAHYIGNVGELQNIIQATCMNSLFKNKGSQHHLDIHILDLPDSVIESIHYQQIPLLKGRQDLLIVDDLLFESIDKEHEFIILVKEQYKLLKSNKLSMEQFFHQCQHLIEQYYNEYLYLPKQQKSIKDQYVFSTIKEIVELLGDQYGISFKITDIQMIVFFMQNLMKIKESQQDIILNELSKIIEKKYNRAYTIASEIVSQFSVVAETTIDNFVIAIVALIVVNCSRSTDMNGQIGIIIAHGFATASSIANAVNQLLGRYIFDGIDMPLDVTTDVIIQKMNQYLLRRGHYQDVILLVDMGSLEDIYKGISKNITANLAIVNNVNTKLALSIGENMCHHLSLEEIFKNVEKNNVTTYQILKNEKKSQVILCSCATGIGTAEKLKAILEDSLPKSLPVKVITYDYSTLVDEKTESELFKKYDILCIVGTLNPNIQNMKFIPIEELILKDSFNILIDQFKEYVSHEDMEDFRKKILKNFSLTNIIENLTFLNPKQLLENVADAIDRLQLELKQTFSYNTCFGLYVHVCCLMERLVVKEGAEEYSKTLNECTEEQKIFVQHVKNAFAKVERHYHVAIPLEEIDYIYIYIKNFQKN